MALSVAFYKSQPTTGTVQSIGGAISATAVTGSLFVATPTAASGLTGLKNFNKTYIYRCIYLKNNHATTSYQLIGVTLNPGNQTYFTTEIALSSAGVNGTAAALAAEHGTAPAVSGSWGTSITVPTLAPTQYHAIWLRQRGKDAGAGSNGTWTLSVEAKY